MEPLLGEIKLFAGNFAPRGWALCDGQLLPINQNTALFSILGTTYGGDGRTTFALPDLRGRFPLHAGAGPDLTRRELGERGGRETADTDHAVKADRIGFGSGDAGIPTVPPFLGLNFIIALEGVFPSRA
jgi:microcystin-dependent protein